MGMDRIVANVYETRNYEMFKKLLGNRDVTNQRINRIATSIKSVGYVMNPIVINGNNEIIDGQGRVEALKLLDMPVHYVIDKNAGLEQCVQLNVNGTPWNTIDYIKSYKQQGNENYVRLMELVDEFPTIPIDVIGYAIHGKTESRNGSSKGIRKHLGSRSTIITGTFTCTEREKKQAYKKLDYVQKFFQIAKRVPGSASHFMKAIIFIAFEAHADENRLYKTCFERQQDIVPFTNVRTAINSISEVYNLNCRRKLDFEATYIAHCAEKNHAYAARWGVEEEAM